MENSNASGRNQPWLLRGGLVALAAGALALGGVGVYDLIHPANAGAINGEDGLECVYWFGVKLHCWMGG